MASMFILSAPPVNPVDHFGFNRNCSMDWLAIYDGPSGISPLLGKICLPGNYTFYSHTNIMGVQFRSDALPQIATWFRATFTSLPRPTQPPGLCEEWHTLIPGESSSCRMARSADLLYYPLGIVAETWSAKKPTRCGHKERPEMMQVKPGPQKTFPLVKLILIAGPDGVPRVNCGDILTKTSGFIVFPNNNQSVNDANCVWFIRVHEKYQIRLFIRSIEIKNNSSCATSYVSVYDGTPLGSPLLGRTCDKTQREFTSTSNSLSIVYFNAGSSSASGMQFEASYYVIFRKNLNVSLSCFSDYMTARIPFWYLQSVGYSSNDTLSLNDPQCHPHVIYDTYEFYIPYNACLTRKQVESDTISYTNTLYIYPSDQVITYRKRLRLTLQCKMYQDTIVDSVYHADDSYTNTLIQYGLYQANLTFYQTSRFISPVSNYPYYVQLNQNLYLQATLLTPDPDLSLFVETCVAYPGWWEHATGYYIVQNGCGKASGYVTYSSPYPNMVRFGFKAFGFMQPNSGVYLHCKLVICNRFNFSSRCRQGCIRRNKRAAEQSHQEVEVVVGPLKLQ
ncbi:deleted in malignant brain tumors 1 protein-like [Bombina bombina]|uniref:deleted in malignant brain tumors 1 protein-like n=1 Tax=Bombina bombina TaxID=8345 RepID=UPI00235AA20E|nr:deleted in malignant brain tumors 1 protein-like [Bombina bombina]